MAHPDELPGLAARELPEEAPFWDRPVTLGLVLRGKLLQASSKGGKKELLAVAHAADLVIATWKGEYRADLFTIPRSRWERELADVR